MKKPKYIWVLVCSYDSGDENIEAIDTEYKKMPKEVYDFGKEPMRYHYEMRKHRITYTVDAESIGNNPEALALDGEEWYERGGKYYFYDAQNWNPGKKIPVYMNYKKIGYTE